jgi:hypothetical protein
MGGFGVLFFFIHPPPDPGVLGVGVMEWGWVYIYWMDEWMGIASLLFVGILITDIILIAVAAFFFFFFFLVYS